MQKSTYRSFSCFCVLTTPHTPPTNTQRHTHKHIDTETPSAAVTRECCRCCRCCCVVADSREAETAVGLIMLYGGRESESNTKKLERSGLKTKRGVFHARALLEQRGGTQPHEKKSQLSDVGCSEHRHGAWPGVERHAS